MKRNFRSEQEYKMWKLKKLWSNPHSRTEYVCIESPITAKGFPDTIVQRITKQKKKYYFIEFKISDEYGNIRFQKTQPPYYRSHKTFPLLIFAFNRKTGKEVHFSAKCLFLESSKYYLNGKLTIKV